MLKASGILSYGVVNRGNTAILASAGPEGHVSLVSGWQGDVTPTAFNQTIQVAIAKNPDGSPTPVRYSSDSLMSAAAPP